MAETELIKWLSTLGIGGVLAGFMFVYYRKDVKQYTELWKVTTDQLLGVIKENTGTMQNLIFLIETQQRNTLRKADIEALIDNKLNDIKRELR